MMSQTVRHQAERLGTLRHRLERRLERSRHLRQLLLLLASGAGVMLVLAPPALFLASAGAGLWLGSHSQGPLDWFLVEVCTAVALFTGLLSVQLFFIHPARPPGLALDEADAPDITSMTRRRIDHFRAGTVDDILLTTDAELEMRTTPTLPLPFRHRHTLCLGAPLLHFLSREQFRLALAGCVAAAARTRQGVSGRALQSLYDWPLIAAAFGSSRLLVARLLRRPLNLVAGLVGTLGSELQEQQEQFPFRWIQKQAGEDRAADYLAALVVARAFLIDCYWPMVYKATERCARPVVKPFSHFGLLLEKLLDEAEARQWLLQAQSGHGGAPDTKELLATLDIDYLHWHGLPERSAIQTLFDSNDILKRLDQYWQASVQEEWQRRYDGFQNDRKRFERLHARWQAEGLDGRSVLNYIRLAARFIDREKALATFSDIYQANANEPQVCFSCGREMLRMGFLQAGQAALQRAAELDSSLSNQAHALINGRQPPALEEHDGEPHASRLSKAG